MSGNIELKFDEIGYWTEIKLEIIKEYAQAYSTILTNKRLSHAYIDGFAGPGVHLARDTLEFVLGSPLNAMQIDPPFCDYFLVDLDGDKIDQLRNFQEVQREEVHLLQGNCNVVLLKDVFPQVRYEDYRRALCLLDPYGLHLDWNVIETAGRMRSIEVFLNFPMMDMNRNALWRHPDRASYDGIQRMSAFWGDDSWRDAAYRKEPDLFGNIDDIKLGNREVVNAYCDRLREIAGFSFVLDPMPMRNSTNAIVYYLIFASHQPVAAKIVKDIFNKYQNRRG